MEVVVVDDGSQDMSATVVRRLGGAARVRPIRQGKAGAAAARNRAFAASHGDFIQFLDADDVIDRDKIERQCLG